MKTIQRYLCVECAKTLRDSTITFKKIPYSEGGAPKCDWCRKPRFCAMYEIRYGRERKHAKG